MSADWRAFFREFRRDFQHTGAIAPSGLHLARALTAAMAPPRAAGRILEVGPGTGAVTAALLPRLVPDDRLDLIEINPTFAAHLNARFTTEPSWAVRRSQVRLWCGSIEALPTEPVYQHIISGLPLNNFSPELVRTLLAGFAARLAPGGCVCFFEYIGVRALKGPFVTRAERQRLREVGRVITRWLCSGQSQRTRVWWNMPPAYVHCWRAPTPQPADESVG